MDTKLLPPGAACLIDANIFIYYLAGSSPNCKSLLQRVANGEIVGYLTDFGRVQGVTVWKPSDV